MRAGEFQRREDLFDDGMTAYAIRAAQKRGDLVRLTRGRFRTKTDDQSRIWRAELLALIDRAGPDAVASHATAAKLHQLEGPWDGHINVLGSEDSAAREPGSFRTKTLVPDHRHVVDGIPVTSLARTLIDLGRVASLDELELALESALRSYDPFFPDQWKRELLSTLMMWPLTPRIRGHRALRQVMARRPPECRPTGSPAETLAIQIFRSVGLGMDAVRQPNVTVDDHRTGRRYSCIPDILFPEVGLEIEIDGKRGHETDDDRSRDNRRENSLGAAVRVLRYTPGDLRTRRREIRTEVRREYDALARHPFRSDVTITTLAPGSYRYVIG